MINPAMLMKMKGYWNRFIENHPKLPQFFQAAKIMGAQEGTVIEVTITSPDGKTISSNIKLKDTDVEMMQELMKG